MSNLLTASKRFMKKNSSTILTVFGAAGVVGTAVIAVKATPKAIELLELAEKEKGEELTKWETLKTVTPQYMPAILLCTSTVACIFGAQILNKKSQAAITSAYILLNQSYKEYKNKVKELYGEDGDKIIRASVAKVHYDDDDDIYEEDELPLFYDEFSKRYFNASNETLLRAKYEINKIINTNGAASLNEYYELVGLPIVDYGEFLGWSAAQMYEMYWDSWLNFHYTKVEMDDGLECFIIEYNEPFPEFSEY